MSNKAVLINNGIVERQDTNLYKVFVPYGIRSVRNKAFLFSNAEEILFERPILPKNNLLDVKCQNDFPVIIESEAFAYCQNLKRIELPFRIIQIGQSAFEYCLSLEKIIIPEFVSEINEYVFYGCKNLKTVYLPDTVKIIKNHAFKGCDSLQDVYLPSGTYIDGFAFDADNIKNIKFHYNQKEKK